jgi:hypothetical protein
MVWEGPNNHQRKELIGYGTANASLAIKKWPPSAYLDPSTRAGKY